MLFTGDGNRSQELAVAALPSSAPGQPQPKCLVIGVAMRSGKAEAILLVLRQQVYAQSQRRGSWWFPPAAIAPTSRELRTSDAELSAEVLCDF
jgi:hypothetical protein